MMTRGHFFMVNFRIGDVPAVQVAGSWVWFLGSCVPFLAFPWNFVKFISRRSLPWLPLLMPWGCPFPSLSWGLYWGYVPPVPSSCCERCWSQKLSSASLHFNKLHLKKINYVLSETAFSEEWGKMQHLQSWGELCAGAKSVEAGVLLFQTHKGHVMFSVQ